MPPRRRARYEEDAEPYARGSSSEVTAEEEGEEEEEEPVEEPRPRRRRSLTAATAGRVGLRYIMDLTGKEPESVTLVKASEHGWVVDVEVIEDRRIPSSSDILAIYEVELDHDGDLMSYRRTRRYRRGAVECPESSSR